MTYSFCQTSCSEYADMSMLQKYAAYAVSRMMDRVRGWMMTFIGIYSVSRAKRRSLNCSHVRHGTPIPSPIAVLARRAVASGAAYTAPLKTKPPTISVVTKTRRVDIGLAPSLLPLEHDWTPNFTQEVKHLLHGNPQPLEER